jgi:hypothetical protein
MWGAVAPEAHVVAMNLYDAKCKPPNPYKRPVFKSGITFEESIIPSKNRKVYMQQTVQLLLVWCSAV